ncbi:dihydroorotase/N-acyl-D-amino-acid deacylase [Murinocardiopsis flavida]|uniref:Dihydroorotase/N-acyl-D-amino-acid deacylase n=1 Tax=Murinocardiopsis flavida TaxID=645275 RepID=A0A2P8CPS1_9ACTN|nr:D-aminoacylase [Murinocardiopsis flavida]PSK86940.1 dihydroorotase/N-acyl-D-amino-acid deacylase [Murinocardiopsis flavida]
MRSNRVLLHGGEVIDGTGAGRRPADVLVEDGRVSAVGGIAPGLDARTVDIAGSVVFPGFIDVHAHDDLALLRPGGVEPKVMQGVTVNVVGNCGHGCAPVAVDPRMQASYSGPILGRFPESLPWRDFPGYLDRLSTTGLRTNAVALVPHGALRASIAGYARRPLDAGELARAERALGEALDRGAAGLSLGLMYAPGDAADRAELVALARVVAAHDRILAAHIRSEGDDVIASLRELLDIARRSGARVQLSHLKVVSPRNRGRVPEILDVLDGARAEGIDITADVYPYTAGSTTAAALFPGEALAKGVPGLLALLDTPAERARIVKILHRPWEQKENNFLALGAERILLSGFRQPGNEGYDGARLSDVAADRGTDPAECLCRLMTEERGELTVVLFQMDEADVTAALSWPWSMVGSDGLPVHSSYTHPRMYGTFARILAEYVRERGLFTLEEATRRMTALPAERFGIPGRGVIRPGAAADLVVAEPERIEDHATFAAPRRFPEHIRAVLVNGAFTAMDGVATESTAGAFLPVEKSPSA